MNPANLAFLRVATAMMFAVSVVLTGILAPPASAEVVRAVEYYHQAFEHYFVTSNPAEIAALDSGVFSGWWRTGQRYRVETSPADGLAPVCRFFTSAYAGKASHFFTASAAECAHVKTMSDWTYEGVRFTLACPMRRESAPPALRRSIACSTTAKAARPITPIPRTPPS